MSVKFGKNVVQTYKVMDQVEAVLFGLIVCCREVSMPISTSYGEDSR